MKKLIVSLGLILTLSFGATFDEGVEAANKGDYKTALIIFEDLAAKGDANSQSYLGLLYLNGEGVKQDYKKAILWYEKAATQGDVAAQSNLGNMYANGEGVRQDKKRGKEWFGKACDNGFQMACDNYKILNHSIFS